MPGFRCRRAARRGGRLPGGGDPCRPWLSAAPVPLAAWEPAHRRLWRLVRPPLPPGARSRGRRARRLAAGTAAVDPPLLQRLDRGWLVDRGFHPAGPAPGPAGGRPGGLQLRWHGAKGPHPAGPWLPGALRRAHPQRGRHQDRRGRHDHRPAPGRGAGARWPCRPGADGARVPARSVLAAAACPRTRCRAPVPTQYLRAFS